MLTKALCQAGKWHYDGALWAEVLHIPLEYSFCILES